MVHGVAPGEALLRLFEETEDARVLMTEDGTVVLVNRRFEELHGRPRADILGHPAARVVPERLRAEYADLRRIMFGAGSGEAMRVNLRALHSDGTEFPVRLTARLIELGPQERLLSVIVRPRVDDDSDGGFRDLLEAVPDGNVIVDAHGRILMANARVEELFGYAEGELIDQGVEILVPEAMRTMHTELRSGFTGLARRHTMGQGTEVLARRKDGSTFPVRVVLSSLGTEDEVLVSAAIRDLSELVDLQEESDRVKDRFLATVSHELRTPLTAILGSVELLVEDLDDVGDPDLRERLARYAAMIVRGARRELALVEDLLALTVVDSGGLRAHGRVSDLGGIAAAAVERFGDRAALAGVHLSAGPAPEPVVVAADGTWVSRAVDCLVSNAVKFTPPGGSAVLDVAAVDGQGRLEVRDSGPGIPAADAERVFERLHRGEDAVREEKQGAGLGLSIARSIVVAYGGTLDLVPTAEGACLRLSLPRAPDDVDEG